MNEILLPIKILHQDAKHPTKGSEHAAGYDLYAIENADINYMCRAKLRTGIAIQLPMGTAGLIWPRSKLANKFGIQVMGGVIDQDYIGEIMISILNTGIHTFEVRKGDRIAQLIIQQVINYYDGFKEVDELTRTERGSAGINDIEVRR